MHCPACWCTNGWQSQWLCIWQTLMLGVKNRKAWIVHEVTFRLIMGTKTNCWSMKALFVWSPAVGLVLIVHTRHSACLCSLLSSLHPSVFGADKTKNIFYIVLSDRRHQADLPAVQRAAVCWHGPTLSVTVGIGGLSINFLRSIKKFLWP